MKIILISLALIIITGCSTTQPATSKDYLFMCKSACKGQVQKYSDDSIECVCKNLTAAQ